jgi:hypothetical protein
MKEKLFCNLRKSWLLILMILPSFLSWGQTPNGTLDFGNPTSGTAASIANTGFSGFRVGNGGGGFTIQNPGQSIGANGELRGIAPTNASINSVGIASTEYGTAASTFTVSFDLHLSGGSSGTWYFFAGNGTSFAASQSNAFTGNQIFTGLRWVFGASNAITTNNRNAGNWNATGLSGTPFAQNTAYSVTIIGNNSASVVSYTGGSVASNTYDLWVNGVLVGDNLAKAQLAANSNINAFRFYAESSTSNVAQLALDNVVWYNTCVLPGSSTPTQVATPSIAASGTAVATNTYVDSTNITLSTSTANATIYYTTDGSTPTTSSNQYSTPFAVTTSTTIKAVAVADGLTNSEVATRDITIVNAPNNDACSNAGVLTVNGSAVNGNLQYSSFVSPFNRKDVWYSVTPTYSATHTITLSDFSGDADLYIFDQSSNCPTTSTDIGSSISDTPEVISVFLTSGVTYYIRVAAWNSAAENTFSIQVTADEPQPSITTNPLTVPQLSSSLGSSDTETIAVNGFLLTENITVALEGADATQFSISEISFTVNSGNASGSLVITYQPTTLQAQHAASVRLSSLGADDVVLTLTGIPSLATPVATDATNVSSSSFTANWNPVSGAESYELDIYRMVASEAPELVVNGGFETGDKSNWTGTNNANYTVQTSSPNSGTYYVSRSQGTGSSILQQDVAVEIGQTYVFSFWYNNYNGSDSNGLKNFTIQGTSGANYIDAGTPKLAAASTWTKYEKTFTATSSNIRISVRAYQLADIDDISLKLASGGTSIQYVPGYEALTVNGTSQQVSGLSPQTEYSYVVRATSVTTTTSNSNEIDVTTLAAPPTFGTVFQSGDLVCDGTNATFFITGLIADSVSNITYTINGDEFTANNVVANASGLATLSIQVFEENNGQNLVITQIERTDATTAPFSPTMNNTVVISVSANQTWYQDTDGDGYGKTDVTLVNCTQPVGYVLLSGDCNDNNPAVNPGATEVCWNGIDDDCDGLQSEGCSPVVVNMATANNTTLPLFAIAVSAQPYSYAGSTTRTYRFTITNNQTGVSQEVLSPTRFVTIPQNMRNYNISYTVTAAAVIDGENVPYAGNTITVFSPVISLVKLAPASCGATLASLTSNIASTVGLNAISYTFRARLTSDNGPTPQYYYVQSPSRIVSMNSFIGLTPQYSTSYTVDVQFEFIDVISNTAVQSGYGETCTVVTPSILLIGLSSPTCGTTVSSIGATISANPALFAQQYEFRIRLTSDNGPEPTYYYTVPSASRFSSLSAFQGVTLQYSTSYTVSVRYMIMNGTTPVWSDFGPACAVTTPSFPVTEITPSLCGLSTTGLDQTLTIVPYPGFPTYRVTLFEQVGEDLIPVGSIERTVPNFKLNMFTAATVNKNYSVAVAIQLGGVFGPDGKACDLSTMVARLAKVPFAVVAYPNPYSSAFQLDVNTSETAGIDITVYDMVGRLVEQRSVSVNEIETVAIGERYPSGVYNVVVTQGEQTKALRVVKR